MIDTLSLMPGGVAPLVAWTLISASFATSFISVVFGLGGGVLMLALLASLLPPAAVIPLHGLVQAGSNAGRMAAMLRAVSWGSMGGFAAGSLIGVALGGLVVVDLPPAFVQIGLGFFILFSVLARPPVWLSRQSALSGAVTSFLTMFFGATGPFVAVFVKFLGLGREAHVATHSALMTMQHALKVLVFGALGFAFAPWAGLELAMLVTGVLGTLAGKAVLQRMTDARFQRALNVVLALIAVRLIWVGARALLQA